MSSLKPGFHIIAAIVATAIVAIVAQGFQRSPEEGFPYDSNDRIRNDHMETRLNILALHIIDS